MCFYDMWKLIYFLRGILDLLIKKMSKVSGTLLTMNFALYISSRGTPS